jgi:glycerol-3-phosphate O-acyltransferase
VDAYRDGRIEDLAIVPVSVTYDQLQEVREYSGEARGAAKTAESLGWLVRFVRAQRGRYGSVYVRFGKPVSLRASLGPPERARGASPENHRLALQRLAFEVSCGINDSIPVTGTALVTLALLGARGRSLTLTQIRAAVPGYLDFARRRNLPLAPTASLDSDEAVRRVLDGLVEQGVARSHASGQRPVYGIAPEQHLAAAYYRNSIVHHFLAAAMAELALLHAGEAPAERRLEAFDAEALALRDLLKFDFFFRERAEFLDEVRNEIERLAPDWLVRLGEGPEGVRTLLRTAPTLCSDMLLRSFVEAYAVVGEVTATVAGSMPTEDELLDRCMGLGQQYLLQGRLRSPEAVSRHLYRSGLQLARNRNLLSGAPDALARQGAFAGYVRDVLRRLSAVHRVAVERVERTLAQQPDAARG